MSDLPPPLLLFPFSFSLGTLGDTQHPDSGIDIVYPHWCMSCVPVETGSFGKRLNMFRTLLSGGIQCTNMELKTKKPNRLVLVIVMFSLLRLVANSHSFITYVYEMKDEWQPLAWSGVLVNISDL